MKLFGVVGWKNSGKTGLMERLIAAFAAQGLSVSAIKHAHHTFDVDHPGKDSYRHRAAGATEVLLSSRNRWALMHELRDAAEPPLEALIARLSPVDLVLVEGYKRDRHPKVGDGVLIAAGAKILGNINIGHGAKIGAGSVVLQDVPAHTTVAGVPAKIVGRPKSDSPALDMDQSFPCGEDPVI